MANSNVYFDGELYVTLRYVRRGGELVVEGRGSVTGLVEHWMDRDGQEFGAFWHDLEEDVVVRWDADETWKGELKKARAEGSAVEDLSGYFKTVGLYQEILGDPVFGLGV